MMYEVGFSASQQSVDLGIVFPDGTVRQAQEFAPGWWQGCVMPYVQLANDVIRIPIASSTYQVVLTNTGSKAISAQVPLTEKVWVDMGYLNFQRTLCPIQDQNIGPVL